MLRLKHWLLHMFCHSFMVNGFRSPSCKSCMLDLLSPSERGKVPADDMGRELNWKQPKGKAGQGPDCSSADLQENQWQQETW